MSFSKVILCPENVGTPLQGKPKEIDAGRYFELLGLAACEPGRDKCRVNGIILFQKSLSSAFSTDLIILLNL